MTLRMSEHARRSFAAAEQPELVATEVRAAFRLLRYPNLKAARGSARRRTVVKKVA